MDKVISALKKPASWIVVGSLGAVALFELPYAVGYMSYAQNAGTIFGALFSMLVVLALCAAEIFAILTKRQQAARTLGVLLLGYMVLSYCFNAISAFGGGRAYGIIELIALVFLIVSGGIALCGMLFPQTKSIKVLPVIAFCGMALFCVLHLVAVCTEFGGLGDYQEYAWVFAMAILSGIARIPAVLFGYLLIAVHEEDFEFLAKQNAPEATAEPAAAQEAEPVEVEEAAPEEPVEEEPKEEPEAEEPKAEEEPKE